MLTFEQIKELIELVAERDLGTVEVERSGFRLLIEGKRPAQVVAGSPPATPHPAPAAQSAPAAPAGTPPAGDEQRSADADEGDGGDDELPEGTHLLTSPIVGTFYRAPSPDAAPFVEVGDRVKQGQVLCIVEAMKLMNEIEADVDGVVLEIYAENEQAVEFGQTLFAIEPA